MHSARTGITLASVTMCYIVFCLVVLLLRAGKPLRMPVADVSRGGGARGGGGGGAGSVTVSGEGIHT